jgi:hypothetical protein
MLGSGITPQDSLALRPTVNARKALLVLIVTAALLSLNLHCQSSQTLRFGAPAAAYGDTAGASLASTVSVEASANADSGWDESDWSQWEAQVREVPAPAGIAVGKPLQVDVSAVDSAGRPLSGARVEVTWVLPGREYDDVCWTGVFGNASVTRTIDNACCGKRCVVAVRVIGDDGTGCAYSAFSPTK